MDPDTQDDEEEEGEEPDVMPDDEPTPSTSAKRPRRGSAINL